MDAPRPPTTLPPTGDFSRFWRIPEGDCELLSARYSQQSFGRHSHERYAIGVITGGVEKLFSRGRQHLCTAGSVVTITPDDIHDGVPGSAEGWVYRMLYIDPALAQRRARPAAFGTRVHPPLPGGHAPRPGPGLPVSAAPPAD
ncbi:MAG: AraC family ligand binding domain-containing protein [Candidatus Pseudomonas colombiensis]|nr:MAG: AraC family ligand binding domain-containing protein [Pseudomonas sp.]